MAMKIDICNISGSGKSWSITLYRLVYQPQSASKMELKKISLWVQAVHKRTSTLAAWCTCMLTCGIPFCLLIHTCTQHHQGCFLCRTGICIQFHERRLLGRASSAVHSSTGSHSHTLLRHSANGWWPPQSGAAAVLVTGYNADIWASSERWRVSCQQWSTRPDSGWCNQQLWRKFSSQTNCLTTQ